ncbi:MAG: peptidoglycan DD-metalloendopeptidase family protein [Bacteroidota bacterium]
MRKIFQWMLFSSLFVVYTFSPNITSAQVVVNNHDTLEVFESLNDSIDLINSMNYFVDSLGYYMFSNNSDSIEIDSPLILADDDLPANGIYADWDSLKVHYPRFDFSTKTDTTYIRLVELGAKYVQPVPGFVTSNFGWRRRMYHYGIDLQLKTGDTVSTCFDGVVRLTKRSRSYGFVVVVRHYNGIETLYAHLSKILVQPNQKITAGEPIGLGGNTGRSRGSHLHFESRYLGAAINPNDIYNFANKTLKTDTLAISKHTFDYMYKISKYKKKLRGIKTHTVKKGETLTQIANKHGITVQKLKKLNKIKGNTIKPNQRVRIR